MVGKKVKKIGVLDLVYQIEFGFWKKNFNQKLELLEELVKQENVNKRAGEVLNVVRTAIRYIKANQTYIAGLAMYYFKQHPSRRILNLKVATINYARDLILEVRKDLSMNLELKNTDRVYDLITEVEAYKKELQNKF